MVSPAVGRVETRPRPPRCAFAHRSGPAMPMVQSGSKALRSGARPRHGPRGAARAARRLSTSDGGTRRGARAAVDTAVRMVRSPMVCGSPVISSRCGPPADPFGSRGGAQAGGDAPKRERGLGKALVPARAGSLRLFRNALKALVMCIKGRLSAGKGPRTPVRGCDTAIPRPLAAPRDIARRGLSGGRVGRDRQRLVMRGGRRIRPSRAGFSAIAGGGCRSVARPLRARPRPGAGHRR